ncbi:tetratricopeptide repeat protein [bacterium CPR1]|nr:tetratricopeptide repeat protein [bacterium CPR1]
MEYRVGQVIDNRWQVYRVLQGGLGRVYIVYDQRDRVPLAIKTFQAEQRNPEVLERFRQEAYTWVKVGSHPNLVRAHYFLPLGDELLLFLEYVDGGDLSDLIGSRELHNPRRALELALEFCDGMIHAASMGLKVHRDIKPANCMLTKEGQLKITDFGLAKTGANQAMSDYLGVLRQGRASAPPDVKLTGAGSMMGTCTHMPPEQFTDAARVDVRADVYAFGVMLYELLTGRLPFDGNNPMTLAYQHFTAPPPRYQASAPLDALLQACLAKQPDQRPADFTIVRRELAGIYSELTGRPAPAPPEPDSFDVSELDNRAVCLLSLGHHQEAIELLSRCLESHPNRRELWAHKGHALVQVGQPREALPCLERALEMQETASAWTDAGLAWELAGDDNAAEKSYSRALMLDAQYHSAYYSLACHQAGRGRTEEALSNFELAITFAPSHPEYRIGLSMALAGAGKFDRAAASLTELIRLQPHNSDAHYHMGRVQLSLGNQKAAEDSLIRAADLDPRNPRAWLALGHLRLSQKRYPEAVQLLELAQGDPEACRLLAMMLVRLERPAEAAGYAERALEANPDSPQTWFDLGLAHFALKRPEQALAAFERAHRLGHPEAADVLRQLTGRS